MTYDEIEAARQPFEAEHIPRVRAALMQQGEDLARLIEAEDFPLSAFFDREPSREAVEAVWRDVIPHFARLTADELRTRAAKADDPWLDAVTRFIQQEGGALIALIDETTLSIVRAVIEEGVREGLSVQDMAVLLLEQWPDIADYRAERIVRTEVIRASNFGALEAARQTAEELQIELQKVWLATPDARTRDSHAAADGQTVGLEEDFVVGGHPASYPGDSRLPPEESIQCRCALAIEPVDEALRSWRDARDARIRADYPALRDQLGQVQAMEELADRESKATGAAISAAQVKRIVYEGARG